MRRATAVGPPSASMISESVIAPIVSTLTKLQQASLQARVYPPLMASGSTRDLMASSERIAWAIARMKEAGIGLEELAERIGCSHATLSQWQNGDTNIDNVKVGLLTRFCAETGVSLPWILTGEGPRLLRYPTSNRVSSLTQILTALEKDNPEALIVVARMIQAAAGPVADDKSAQ